MLLNLIIQILLYLLTKIVRNFDWTKNNLQLLNILFVLQHIKTVICIKLLMTLFNIRDASITGLKYV